MRPGGTVSGPTMVFLADWTIYVALLAVYGGAAMAVTTSLTINFLRKPGTTDLVAECQLLHSGRRLAMAEVKIYSAGVSGPVAQVTATYALPQS